MIWNSIGAAGLLIGAAGAGLLYMLVVWPLLGLIAWILALRMVQSGINQVRQEKAEYLTAEKTPSEEAIPEPDVPSHATEP